MCDPKEWYLFFFLRLLLFRALDSFSWHGHEVSVMENFWRVKKKIVGCECARFLLSLNHLTLHFFFFNGEISLSVRNTEGFSRGNPQKSPKGNIRAHGKNRYFISFLPVTFLSRHIQEGDRHVGWLKANAGQFLLIISYALTSAASHTFNPMPLTGCSHLILPT